ncbi:hypothetical protein [Virgibacillus ndiopensis]|uniref:hypothetical protein n=1 Tax=Virgibacillus ndiopensis TaxID=2004408 RepID=UPI000C07DD59|nr:hypothetical protein [Virgibacillus ndiopensis]
MNELVQKWGVGGLLIIIATALYIVSLLFPWSHVLAFMSMNGFQHDGYIVLIVFAYPLYTVLSGKTMARFFGLGCSIIAVIFLLYYMFNLSEDYLGTSISTAGSGLYIAILSAIILLIGTILKIREVK